MPSNTKVLNVCKDLRLSLIGERIGYFGLMDVCGAAQGSFFHDKHSETDVVMSLIPGS